MHNNDAEQAILGGIFRNPDAYDDVVEIIRVDDFYLYQHRLIWEAIGDIVSGNNTPDAISVSEHLDRKGKLDEAGEFQYISSLALNIGTSSNVVKYAQVVADYARERRTLAALNKAGDIIHGDGDTADKIDKALTEIQDAAEAKDIGEGAVWIKDALREWVDDLDRRFTSGTEIQGLSTGYSDLDKKLNGLKPGKMYIVAGRPSMGKSVIGQNICEHVAVELGKPSAFFSMEMPTQDVTGRVVCSIGRVDNKETRSGKVQEDSFPRITNAARRLQDSPLYIDDAASLSPNELRARCRKLKRTKDIQLVVVDYLQLMRAPGYKNDRVHEIEEISRQLKAMAKELNIPVVVISQLNRSVDGRQDKRPIMSDLRESGAIEQDADVIAFIYRQDQYENDESKHTSIAELIVRKNRDGETGTILLLANLRFNRFDNFDGREYQQEQVQSMRGIDL